MPNEIDLVRARINIVDLVGQRVLLKRAGKEWTGLCPFHDDKNPSFRVSETLGRYKCWACGASGDIFKWVMETQRVDFREALEMLARDAGITLSHRPSGETKSKRESYAQAMAIALRFFRDELPKASHAREYCESRGLDEATILEWQIGYAPDIGDALASRLKRDGIALADAQELFLVDSDAGGGFYDRFRGRLIFPIHDERGSLVAFGGRLLGDGIPKYINSGDTPLYSKRRVLYGMHKAKEAIAAKGQAVLVEGYLDVIACHRAGVGTALASLGTALSEDHAKLLKRWCKEVVILYDADPAGQNAAERAADVLQAEGLSPRIALMPTGEDPDTLLRTVGPAAVLRATEGGLTPLDYRVRQVGERLDPATEEYWQEVVLAIAKEPSAVERSKHMIALSNRHPAERDPERALRNLRRQVAVAGRRLRQYRRFSENAPKPAEVVVDRSLHPFEQTLFRALLEEDLRERAHLAIRDERLFLTQSGLELSRAFCDAYPERPPLGPPAAWLSSIEPEWARQRLGDLGLDQTVKIDGDELSGAVSRLRLELEKRSIREMHRNTELDDDGLAEVARRLRKVAGSEGSG